MTTECLAKFETNGGSAIEPVIGIYGELLERPKDPIRAGKHLVGWYRDIHLTEEWDFDTDTVEGNMTLYARWADGDPVARCRICGDTALGALPLCWRCLLLILLLLALAVYGYRRVKRRRDGSAFGQ